MYKNEHVDGMVAFEGNRIEEFNYICYHRQFSAFTE